jgi:hypothetical protein
MGRCRFAAGKGFYQATGMSAPRLKVSKCALTGRRVWSIIATVSFRLSSVNFCRASIAGLVFLVLAEAVRGGEGARNIEVVPLHGTSMDTNFDQLSRADRQTFENWAPRASRAFTPVAPKPVILPPPRPQTAEPTQREQELLDRRRNWVFMTPEDYASPNGDKDSDVNGLEKDGDNKKPPMTAMQRYYQGLSEADHAASTNQFGKLDAEHSFGRTNHLAEGLPNADRGSFPNSPFNMTPEVGVFDPVRQHDFADVFGSDNSPALRTPESIRAEAEQKAHMDTFKELWNIDQPAAAAVVLPVPTPVKTAPLFSSSAASMQPASSLDGLSGGGFINKSQPAQPTVTSSRVAAPPRSDFAPPQRPF